MVGLPFFYFKTYILHNKKSQVNLFSLSKLSHKQQYPVGIGIICFSILICFLFSDYVDPEVVAFILLLVLSVIAMVFDILPVLLCSLISALSWGFFFIPPVFSFAIDNVEDIVTLCMYFLISLVSTVLTYKIRQMEKAVVEKEKKAEELKLYNTLLNSLSHEFRTPISAIIGAADNLINEKDNITEEIQTNLIKEISIGAFRLNRLVENLLNMSRIESGFLQLRKDWCDVKELIYNSISHLEEQAQNHIICVSIQEELPLCKLDYGLMEQVFFNLINNALQYTAKGTEINIEASYNDALLTVRVMDNGKGFPVNELKKVFDKFYRINNFTTGGTGLGLSIVNGFIRSPLWNYRT